MVRARAIAATAVVMLAAAVPLAGCGSSAQVSPGPAASTTSDAPAEAPTEGSAEAPIDASADGNAGPGPGGTVQGQQRLVLLDPGHNGGNAAAPATINKTVPDGRGGTKACNTTGTATDAGFPEHRFTWDVARRVGVLLQRGGVTVRFTRDDDKGAGPCVDVRGAMAEKVDADAAVSIHADGGAPAGKGFHVAYSAPPLSQSQGQPSISLATQLRDSMRGAGLQTSTYVGKAGLSPRNDLAGLNLARRPAVLVECANMRNADEAVMVSSAVGRQRIADAIAYGILAWLARE